MRSCIVCIILLVILNAGVYYALTNLKNAETMINYHLPLIFPLISAIITFLAYQAIRKDEKLVSSNDRLR